MSLKILSGRLRNDNGQMAIFIALIFQVLFVAFAMAINIGLVVHDKINLQNAVDFAAYYAAQRQAELLNVIAHQNYQIRQGYKLMAWRYRVLGSSGDENHPSRQGAMPPENMFNQAPSLCVSRQALFSEVQGSDSVCKQTNISIPELKFPPPIAGFDPVNILFALSVRKANKNIGSLCQNYGSLNFAFAATAMASFRQEQALRKQMILGIAANMARPFQEMIDLNGDTVEAGTRKTFENNLTYENYNSRDGSPEYFNSIQGITPTTWLREMAIKATMIYTDIYQSGGCKSEAKPVYVRPSDNGIFSQEEIDNYSALTQPQAPGSVYQLALGFEKNPWYMIYAGVKARTKPRQVFWPFGERISFEATSFAQPFGGRIGPWYYANWGPADSDSSGGNKIDPVVPPLYRVGNGNSGDDSDYLPNYSRYPGDRLGLKSAAAQAAIAPLSGMSGSFQEYYSVFDLGAGRPNDTLPFNPSSPGNGGVLREYETAAIAPDLFDVAYYSIDPDFMGVGTNLVGSSNGERLKSSKGLMGIPDTVPVLGDHGAREGDDRARFGVKSQLAVAAGAGRPPLQRLEAAWFIRERAHLLVDWVHNDTFEIADKDAPISPRLGTCDDFDDDLKIRSPGTCVGVGGRTGYSVKLVSGDYLTNTPLRLGGGEVSGNIKNPPPPGF